jgi:hypothetical protein
MLLQPLCSEGSVGVGDIHHLEGESYGDFQVSFSEDVYRGCRDLNFSVDFDDVTLHSTIDAEGIHVFVPEETQRWHDKFFEENIDLF